MVKPKASWKGLDRQFYCPVTCAKFCNIVVWLMNPNITWSLIIAIISLWYSEELQAQRCTVRNRERLWGKHLQDHLWLAFKIERNRYNKMLKDAKEAFISEDIVSHRKDIKYLYKIVYKFIRS